MFKKQMDEVWFCGQIDEMRRAMFYVSYSILRNEWDAEDATANAILKAYEKRDTLQDRKKFRLWMLRILQNECYDFEKKRKKYVLQEPEELPGSLSPPDPELWMLIHELEEKDRIAFLLYHLEGYRVREVGELLGESVRTIHYRLARAKKALKKALEL